MAFLRFECTKHGFYEEEKFVAGCEGCFHCLERELMRQKGYLKIESAAKTQALRKLERLEKYFSEDVLVKFYKR